MISGTSPRLRGFAVLVEMFARPAGESLESQFCFDFSSSSLAAHGVDSSIDLSVILQLQLEHFFIKHLTAHFFVQPVGNFSW